MNSEELQIKLYDFLTSEYISREEALRISSLTSEWFRKLCGEAYDRGYNDARYIYGSSLLRRLDD